MTTFRIPMTAAAFVGAAAIAFGQSPYTPPPAFTPAGRAANPWAVGGANPYSTTPVTVVNPYATGVTPGGFNNPYMTNPYSPWYTPWFGDLDAGGVLYGQAQMLQAYSGIIISQEQARILREQAIQAKLDTARRRFDFELYIKANTPTFADEQKKIARNTLKRIQVSSNPVEIASGKALNILLDDVRQFPNKKANMDPIVLSTDVLSHLNVTTKNFGVGILRNNGKFTWPVALVDFVPADVLRTIDRQVQIAVANAAQGKIDGQVLADINLRMNDIRTELVKRVNDMPAGKYLDADRFLNDFREARQALEEGQFAVQDRFHRFIQGGKTIQEVADFMVTNGLRFAPATPADEAAYRAFHSALVSFDMALNNTVATASEAPQPAPPPAP